MIECELCGSYFHPDEISNCPECGIEICEKCFQRHVRFCGQEDGIEEDDEISSLPRECPQCGAELELDTDFDKTTLLCPECDYQLDVTEELSRIEYDIDEEYDD